MSKRGSILIIVLWVVSILTILAVSISSVASARIFFTKGYRNQVSAYFIALSGLTLGVAQLELDKGINAYDSLKEPWSNNVEVFKDRPVGGGFLNVLYDYSNYNPSIDEGGSSTNTFYGLIDEERKININNASASVLQSLLQEQAALAPLQAKGIAESILDWRDADDNKRESGAETAYYQSLPQPYACKNGKFELLEELMLVKGMRPDILQALRNFITIYGDGRVNINTAPYPVLRALGMADVLARKVINCRAGTDETEGTEDDDVFAQPSVIVSTLNKKQTLSQEEIAQINNLIATNAIGVRSNHFRVEAYGYLSGTDKDVQNTKNSRKIVCIIDRNGKIVFWRE